MSRFATAVTLDADVRLGRLDSTTEAEVRRPPATANIAGTESTFPYVRLPQFTAERIVGMNQWGFNVRTVELPVEHRSCLSKNQRFTLQSQAWTLRKDTQNIGDVRSVFICGTKNTIVNTWVFPYAPSLCPVFAAELIAIGDSPKLAFLDIQIPALAEDRIKTVRTATTSVVDEFEDLRIAEVPPAWAIDATAGNYLFSREQSPAQAIRIAAAYGKLLDVYLELLLSLHDSAGVRLDSTEGVEALHRYQLHHLESSPGKVFLSKIFGDAWTASFLTDFLFRLPGELA